MIKRLNLSCLHLQWKMTSTAFSNSGEDVIQRNVDVEKSSKTDSSKIQQVYEISRSTDWIKQNQFKRVWKLLVCFNHVFWMLYYNTYMYLVIINMLMSTIKLNEFGTQRIIHISELSLSWCYWIKKTRLHNRRCKLLTYDTMFCNIIIPKKYVYKPISPLP